MPVLGLLNGVAAHTDLTTKPWVIKSGVEVLNNLLTCKVILQPLVDV